MDAIRPYGNPEVFITSAYKWRFPTPIWLQNAAKISGKMPTQLAYPGANCSRLFMWHKFFTLEATLVQL